MKLNTTIQHGMAKLHVAGRFDFARQTEFRDEIYAAIDKPAIRGIQVDLSAIDYIDSSTLAILIVAKQKASAVEKWISLIPPVGPIRQMLDNASLHRIYQYA